MREILPAGLVLHRVHHRRFAPTQPNRTVQPSADAGGRFDSLVRPDEPGGYGYLYAAGAEPGAFAEAFVRQLDYDTPGPRLLPWARVRGRVVSVLRLVEPLQVVSLRTADAQQLGQDDWLTTCYEQDYLLTRAWAAAIRSWAPDADGLVWRGKRDSEHLAYVLFDDQPGPGGRRPLAERVAGLGPGEPLDAGPGLVRLRRTLRRHLVALSRQATP